MHFGGRGTRRIGYWLIALFGSLTVCAAFTQQSHRVDQNALKHAASQPNEWLTYGRDYAETHYSPLKEINDQNVSRLGHAWSWETGTTAMGKKKWRYDPDVDRSFGSHACCGPNNRGVAIYDGKVFVGVLDGRLVALDEETDKKIWSVKTTEDDYQSITGAPRVVKGKVIIGNAGAEYGVRGYVSAYEAKTGKLDWRFYTVLGDPSKPVENPALTKALATWHGEWWKTGGGGTVWDAFAYDPEPDLLCRSADGSENSSYRRPGTGSSMCSIASRANCSRRNHSLTSTGPQASI
jgi:quinohemoprotein ethanol dehydrogenase